MPTIKNQKFDFEMNTYRINNQDPNLVDHIETTTTRSFFDCFLELSRKHGAGTGVGNLDEQIMRMDLIGKFKAAIEEDKTEITIDEAPANFLKKHVINYAPIAVAQGFIDFQKLILNWK